MTNPSAESSSPHRTYTERRATAEAELKRLDAVSARYANLRAVVFLGGLAAFLLPLFNRLPKTWWWAAGAALVVYVVLAVMHHQVFLREERQRLYVQLNERGLARLTRGWHDFAAERGERFLTGAHLYAADLDVFGQGSVFQLMNETATKAGEERLAKWLSAPARAEEVRTRQGAARELMPRVDFRQDVCVEARTVAKEKADPGLFIQWAESGPSLTSIRWARPVAVVLPLVTLTLLVLGNFGVVPGKLWWAGVLAQLAVVAATKRPLREMEERMSAGERGFVRYAPVFERVEGERFEHPELRRVCSGLQREGEAPVSTHLKAFSRLYSFVEFKRHQFHPVVHLLTLWDVHALFALEGWRERHGAQVRGWFDALAELEALTCLAGLAFDRPTFTWPTLEEDGPRVKATGLGHPLLDEPVLNDVELPGPASALLLTGSNMSGKTTLLRSLGLNAVLALAGAPVCAQSFSLTPLQVLTSMRVKDSLERGVSYFHAEVLRIKAVLDAAAAAKGQAMFLLDEILLGTNTRERQIASREVLRLLLATGACGGVTTHDLSLASLAEEYGGKVVNMHFRDHLENGKMVFDYRLRPGVVDTTNALRVLKLAGVPVEDPEQAPSPSGRGLG